MPTGAIYGAESGIVRRVVDGADAGELEKHVGSGEALYIYQGRGGLLADVVAECEAEITKIIGKGIDSARCAVVNEDGSIEGFINADPALDAIEDKTQTLVTAYSNEITAESTYDPDTKLFTAPIKTIGVYNEKGEKIGEQTVGGTIEVPIEVIEMPVTP